MEDESSSSSAAAPPSRLDTCSGTEVDRAEIINFGDEQPRKKPKPYSEHVQDTRRNATHADIFPKENIEHPSDNDFLLGEAATSNAHVGNKKYRRLISKRRVEYMLSDGSHRRKIVNSLVRKWKSQDPPGRFLKRNTKTKLWYDVGEDSSKEKTASLFNEKDFLEKQFGIVLDKNAYPMREILEPTNNDFIVGRGSFLNKEHEGNVRFRKIVNKKRTSFQAADRAGKQEILSDLIDEWRCQEPMGRFLAKGKNTIFWHDVGDDKAEDRVRQFLRDDYSGDGKPFARKDEFNNSTGRIEKYTGSDIPK
ncbi:hypothetical protein ACHAXS_010828 [Conticribra weissflogii]